MLYRTEWDNTEDIEYITQTCLAQLLLLLLRAHCFLSSPASGQSQHPGPSSHPLISGLLTAAPSLP